MRCITLEDMTIADVHSVWLGVPRRLLMENAGGGVARAVVKRVKPPGRVVVLAGTGNKGGDGAVAARHLASAGFKVTYILLGMEERIRTEEARSNFKALKNMEDSVRIFTAPCVDRLERLREEIIGADVIIDAILGTGIRGAPREPAATAIRLFNEAQGLKVSIDLPSGMHPDTGRDWGLVAKPDIVVTMHAIKMGMCRSQVAGDIEVVNIGIPPEAELYAGPGDLLVALRRRDPFSKKGDNGVVIAVGGSNVFHGAPWLMSAAALRTGVDLVFLFTPSGVAPSIRALSPNLIVIPLKSTVLTPESISPILRYMEKADVLAIGPGLGLDPRTGKAVEEVVQSALERGLKVVMDADALKTRAPHMVRERGRVVLTPHAGEFKIMMGEAPPDYSPGRLDERIEAVRDAARKLNSVILLKGHYDFISDGERIKVCKCGNPAMTAGGTGDVLTGIVAGLLARGAEPFRAAVAAAFLNGYTGDMAVKMYGERITASDLIDLLPRAFRELEEWLGVGRVA